MDNHTKDEWALADKGDYGDFDGNSRVILAGDRRLAAVHVSDDDTDDNAKLMAAAPKLARCLLQCLHDEQTANLEAAGGIGRDTFLAAIDALEDAGFDPKTNGLP